MVLVLYLITYLISCYYKHLTLLTLLECLGCLPEIYETEDALVSWYLHFLHYHPTPIMVFSVVLMRIPVSHLLSPAL